MAADLGFLSAPPVRVTEAEDLEAKFTGKRVKFVGMYGKTDGPVGKVWRVTRYGVWVTFLDGHREHSSDGCTDSRYSSSDARCGDGVRLCR